MMRRQLTWVCPIGLVALALWGGVLAAGADDPEAGQHAEQPAGQWHSLIVQNVAAGQIKGAHTLLTKLHKWPSKNITVLGKDASLEAILAGPATESRILAQLDRLAEQLTEKDRLLILFACHMRAGFLINASLTYEQFEKRLAKFRPGTEIIVVLEGCYTGGAIPVLKHADVLYTAASKTQETYGGFLMFLLNALGRKKEDARVADTNDDQKVSLDEAYLFASDEKRLTKWYRSLPKKTWPTQMVPTPMRVMQAPELDHKVWLSNHKSDRETRGD
jgi:hypothetical protein